MDWALTATQQDYQAIESFRSQYQSAVGSLIYAMLGTRPDLAFSVSVVSRYTSNPNRSHWEAVKRIFCYICGIFLLQITSCGGLSNLQGYWKGVVVGVCDLWSEAEPSQNREERGGEQEAEGGKTACKFLRMLDSWSRYRGKAPYQCISQSSPTFHQLLCHLPFLPPATYLLLGMYFSPLHITQMPTGREIVIAVGQHQAIFSV